MGTVMKANRRKQFGMDTLERRRMLSTYTVNAAGGGANYTDLETAIVNSPAGSTLLVSPGTYTAHATSIDVSPVFWINKSLTIESTGGPSVTTLVVPAGTAENLLISSSNVRIDGFTLQHGQFCADVDDFLNNTTLTNETLKNLNLQPDSNYNNGHGILYETVTHSIIDNCTVGVSYANGIMLDNNSGYDTVENCTVNGTIAQQGIAVKNSNNNQIVGNTVTSSGFDGMFLLNASYNRVTDNTLYGFQNDGLVVTDTSDFNYIALNSVASSGYADGRTAGAGIWLNNESDGNTVYGNAVSGAAECGIDDFVSSNNTISSNDVWANYEGGIFLFDATNYPASVGNVPTDTIISNNYIHANKTNGGVTIAGAVNTTIENNFISGTYTGVVGSSGEVGLQTQRATNVQFINNSVVSVSAGVYIYATTSGLSMYRNRFINEGTNYCFTGATATFDDSVTIGGNYWGDQPTTSPYTRFIFGTTSTLGGGNIDDYPFATEALNQPYAVNVAAPLAGTSVADFSKRAIQWTSTGSSLVDIYYTSSETGDVLIASNRGDTGSYIWSVPNLAAHSDYQIKIVPKNIFGQAMGSAGLSGQFAITSSSGLQVLAPGDGESLTPGATTTVAWSSATAGTSVDVQVQVNGGSWATLASGITDDCANVTIPSSVSNDARIRVVAHGTSTGDEQDGTFRITNFGGVYALGNQLIGSNSTINWLSPAAATTVDVQYWNGLGWQTIVSQVPDVGHLNWFVPEMATNGAQVLVQFHNSTGAVIGSAAGNPFNIQYTLATGTLVNDYRAYNPNNKAQLFTSNLAEYNSLGAGGWQLLGARYQVYTAPVTINGVSAVPNYRLYDPTTQQHFWTTDRSEYFALRNNGTWIPIGVANYEFNTQVTGSVPLYRSAQGGPPLLELWTTSLIEYDALPGEGWTNEGVDAYVLPVSS